MPASEICRSFPRVSLSLSVSLLCCVRVGGVWPSAVSAASSSVELDFFASAVGPAGAAAASTAANSSSLQITTREASRTTMSPSSSLSPSPPATNAKSASESWFESSNESGTIATTNHNSTHKNTSSSSDFDSLDWLADASTHSAANSRSTSVSSAMDFGSFGGNASKPQQSPIPTTAEEGAEDDEEEFADFSSATAAASATKAASAASFTVVPAAPTRGELSLQKLTELVAGLPDLSFLVQVQ